MSSEKQLILLILVWVVVFGYQYYKDKKKNDYWKKYRRSQGWE
jgi:predicted negative regulator of RcsB-dependent stress response